MTATGLTLTRQAPVAADATIVLDNMAPSAIWTAFAKTEGFKNALLGSRQSVAEVINDIQSRINSVSDRV